MAESKCTRHEVQFRGVPNGVCACVGVCVEGGGGAYVWEGVQKEPPSRARPGILNKCKFTT